jgi:hypothetical protein
MDSQICNLLTVKQLKAKLQKLGLPVSGNKQALINRLQDHYQSFENQEMESFVRPKAAKKADDTFAALEAESQKQKARLDALEMEIKILKKEKELKELRGEYVEPDAGHNLQNVGLREAIVEAVSATKIPEPPVFKGNPLEYTLWKIKLNAMMQNLRLGDGNKIMYLSKYLAGKALEVVQHLFLVDSDNTYDIAIELLDKRFGDPFLVSEAFRTKLEEWPDIKADDFEGLRSLSDYLKQCVTAKRHMEGLRILDDNRENQNILRCLPQWLILKWREKIVEYREKFDRFPPFEYFSEFVEKQSTIACEPNTAQLLRKKRANMIAFNTGISHLAKSTKQVAGRPDNWTETESPKPSCFFCSGSNHSLNSCFAFNKKPWSERHHFILKSGICFACLQGGHKSKLCKKRETCGTCKKSHPTCLHNPQSANVIEPSPNASSESSDNPVTNDFAHTNTICHSNQASNKSLSTAIVPVWVSSTDNPQNEVLVYALLDSMSDLCFILDETSDKLQANHSNASLKLGTMSSLETRISCRKFSNLQVRAFNSSTTISLPPAYSRGFIPVDRSHIPTPEKASRWEHLSCVASELPPLQSCEVGLLIGYNCSQAFIPRQTVIGQDHEPFAYRTDLGWGIIGNVGRPAHRDDDDVGIANRITVMSDDNCSVVSERDLCEKNPDLMNDCLIQGPNYLFEKSSFVDETSVTDFGLESDNLEIVTTNSLPISSYDQSKNVSILDKACTISMPEKAVELQPVQLVDKTSSLVPLDPFLDENGPLKVGGRLSYVELPESCKHPIIIPRSHHVSKLIIGHYQNRVAHQGQGATTNSLHSNGFWVVGCSRAVSSDTFRCVISRKRRTKWRKDEPSFQLGSVVLIFMTTVVAMSG